MLTTLRIGNFKAFADTQCIPIRPLTLIFGANSSGKSSIIHALLLAQHAFETGDLDVHRTKVGGESVDLGGFLQYLHRGESIRRMELALEIDAQSLVGQAAGILAPVGRVELKLVAGIQVDDQGRARPGANPQLHSFEIQAEGRALLRMFRRQDGILQLQGLDQDHPILVRIINEIVKQGSKAKSVPRVDSKILRQSLADIVPKIISFVDGVMPEDLYTLDDLEKERERGSLGRDVSSRELLMSLRARDQNSFTRFMRSFVTPGSITSKDPKAQLMTAIGRWLAPNLGEVVFGLKRAIANSLSRLQYLGPLRSYPPRHLAFSEHHDPNWLAGGGFAWDVVRKDAPVRDAINNWLRASDRLQTPYELIVRDLVPLGDIEAALAAGLEEVIDEDRLALDPLSKRIKILIKSDEGKEIEAEMAGASMNPEREATQLAEKVRARNRRQTIHDLVLRDRRTNTTVSHRDVGIGISQVLPVLVIAHASRGKILAMEQPEIHLHPALQAELGDVFIESALGDRKNTFILETHSEHLILRILKRIRESAKGVPGGRPRITPDDVSLLFVSAAPTGAAVQRLRIDEHGKLIDPCPGGFFEESFEELF